MIYIDLTFNDVYQLSNSMYTIHRSKLQFLRNSLNFYYYETELLGTIDGFDSIEQIEKFYSFEQNKIDTISKIVIHSTTVMISKLI